MSQAATIQQRAEIKTRGVRVISREQTAAEQVRRNAIAIMRVLVQTYPKDAQEIVKELVVVVK